MGKFLKITPLDPLFFRSPMPFTAGEQDWASSEPLPLPSTLYGAIRSFILSKRDFDKFVNGRGYEDIGTPEQKGNLKLKFFSLAKEINGEIKPYFPVPANLLGKCKNEELHEIRKSLPREMENVILSSADSVDRFFYLQEDGFEPTVNQFLSIDGLKKYLEGINVDISDFTETSQFFVEEPKVGIARERDTKATQEGKLYRVSHRRYKKGAGLVAWVEGTDENLNGIFTLGGERRTAEIKEIENPFGEFPSPTNSNKFLVYLATPAIFINGWRPSRVIAELEKNGIQLKLLTAAILGYRIVSGWDIQRKAPKTLFRAVPEGSVFVFEVKGEKEDVKKAVEAFHQKNISDNRPEEGYGFALVGKI